MDCSICKINKKIRFLLRYKELVLNIVHKLPTSYRVNTYLDNQSAYIPKCTNRPNCGRSLDEMAQNPMILIGLEHYYKFASCLLIQAFYYIHPSLSVDWRRISYQIKYGQNWRDVFQFFSRKLSTLVSEVTGHQNMPVDTKFNPMASVEHVDLACADICFINNFVYHSGWFR